MAGPLSSSRSRSSSVTSDFGATARVLDAQLSSPKPDISPISPRRGARGSLAIFFASKSERSQTASPDLQVDTTQPPPQSDVELSPKAARRASRTTFLARSLSGKPRPLSRTEAKANGHTLPAIFASLPSRAQDRIRSSYDSNRRSFGRPESFTLGDIAPIPDVPDPETPSSEPHSFRLAGSFERDPEGFPKRRSMASFARPPITGRRISSSPFDEDDLLESIGKPYRASTADLIDFLRDTGPEDSRRPHVEKSPSKDVDRDGASSTRSRSKSSIFRIAGRKREKSRPSIPPAVSSHDVPPMPSVALPRLAIRQEDGEVRTSFSQILPLLNLNQEGADSPGTRTSLQGSLSGQLPPNTREHRLPDGTTILMITTPQTALQPETLAHSRPRGSITAPAKEETSECMASGPESGASQPPTLKPLVDPAPTKLKTHSPSMSVSSDGTLSTAERHRAVSGEDRLALLPRIRTLETQFGPQTPTTAHAPTGRSIMQTGLLQVRTPKTRPRGYSSPDSVSPPSTESTPTVETPVVPAYSPSASIAPTPELTPHKSPVNLPEPPATVNSDSLPKSSAGSLIVVDGLQFPAPPAAPPQPRRRPNTIGTPPRGKASVSPSRSSKSMRVTRSPRRSNPSEGDLIKARAKKPEHGPRPQPLNLDAVPSYREFKANAAELQTQPGELTGLELDLSAGSSELGRKRDSLMEQHQQLFLNANPFQTPPSPSDPFLAPPVRGPPALPPPAGGPPAMPLPPSPLPLHEPPMLSNSPISPRSNPLINDLRRTSWHSQRSRLDSLRIRSSAIATPIPASPVTSDAVHTLNTVLAAQRGQFDSMSKQLVDMVKAFEEEKRAYEQRIQELAAVVAEKEAKSKQDERKIKGLEWLVGNLNLRATVGKGRNNRDASSDSESAPAASLERRRSSFSGLGANDDVPVTPLADPISRAFDPAERAKRAASMDDVLQNLIALSLPSSGFSSRNPSRIYEWAAQTAQEQD